MKIQDNYIFFKKQEYKRFFGKPYLNILYKEINFKHCINI